LKAVDPEIKMGAWLETNEREDGAGQRKAQWDSLIMPELRQSLGSAGAADWLNIHSYFWQPMDWSVGQYVPYQPSDLYHADAGLLGQTKADLHEILEKYFPEGKQLPVALTEYNINQAFPHADPQVNEHISALVTADIIGQAVTSGVAALNYFALTDGWKTDSCDWGEPCPGAADLGMATWGQPNVTDGTPRPAWFAFAAWDRAMGNTVIQSESSDSEHVSTYASSFATGEVGFLVINRRTDDIILDVPGVPENSDVRGWILSASVDEVTPVDYSPGSKWNGQGPSTVDGTCGPTSIEDVKPYGLKVSGSSASIYVPKVSVVGFIFYPEASVRVI
jgi:hypothetical protein